LQASSGDATLTVKAGSHLISAPLTLAGSTTMSVGDTSTLTLAGALATDRTVSLIKSSLGTLQIQPNAAPLVLATLQIDAGSLDVTRNDLILTATPRTTVTGYLQSHALTSSSLTATMGLAVVTGADYHSFHGAIATFDGQMIMDSDTLVKYTLLGDTNLDGQITLDDYIALDAGFRIATSPKDWAHGDYNYDGVIDAKDYALIDYVYSQQAGPSSAAPMITLHASWFGPDYLNNFPADRPTVPEPATIGLLALASLSLLRRPRRRSTG